jgi:hypothetical protein
MTILPTYSYPRQLPILFQGCFTDFGISGFAIAIFGLALLEAVLIAVINGAVGLLGGRNFA